MAIAMKERRHKHSTRTQLSVDYPCQGEKIRGAEYSFRVNAPSDVRKVEVALNHGAWRPCRQASGFWWHDWSGYANGEYEIVARVLTAEGRSISSEPHEFLVELEKAPA